MNRLSIILFNALFVTASPAQGLEGISVEKYYVADKADSKYKGMDQLPENAVTYRIYVDMKEGYNLQSVYGAPNHDMVISTTSSFFNHPEFGSYIPNLIANKNLETTTVMLDSWIGMGAGAQQSFAVLKAEDDTLGTVRNSHNPKLLQSSNSDAGIPIKVKDGLFMTADLPPRVSQVGLDSLFSFFDKNSTSGTGFNITISNGGWGCVGGSKGVDTKVNRVCIGQFTTNGDFYFEFNIQIGSPEHGIEQYVAKDPVDDEQLFKELVIMQPVSSKNKSKK